jgi:signal transduction histidine kinase
VSIRHPVTPGGVSSREDIPVPVSTLQALEQETERLTDLVDDLFELARTDTGAMEVQLEPVDVVALLHQLVDLMRPLAQREGAVTLLCEATATLPPAMADRARLHQILSNLIRNAVRHTPDGGIVAVSAAREGQTITISVADTGEGIPPEHLSHIFERFYRVDEARTRSSGGAGLGLAIVREFVELMGGHVDVESTPGEGSCFRVSLPIAGNA